MTLTIIVCHMRDRRQLLTRCLWYLEHQTCDKATTLVMHSNRPKGDKLNLAFSMVDTTHVMVVDDDDWVAPHLVESVIDYEDDCVTFDSVMFADGRYAETTYQETASHICPIRTDLALKYEFGNEYLADIKWTKKVAQHVESETHIDDALYFYDKWNKPGGDWSPPRYVGWWPHDKREHRWL